MLHIYLHDIARYRPLTLLQEQSLAQAARQGDAETRNQLIQSHLPLVVNIARQHLRAGIELLDLIQEGNIGLIKAVDLFDPTQGNRLSTLAKYWAEKYILRFLRNEQNEYVSLDMPISDSGEALLLRETIEDRDTIISNQTIPRIDAEIEYKQLLGQLAAQLDKLSPNEQEVLKLMYGLQEYPCMSREEIAKSMGLRADQISHIKTRALRRMKRALGS